MGVPLQGRFKGTVIKYNVERGFGFVSIVDKVIREDAFIHFSQIDPKVDAFKKLLPGQVVEFSLERSEKGLVAKDLLNLEEGQELNGNR